MKIYFEDGSFIHIDEAVNNNDKILTVTMCGLNSNGNTLTMSSSELDLEETLEISNFLQEILKKFA